MVRTFLAIELPHDIRQKLSHHMERWRSIKADVKWVQPSRMHITLKFFGEIPEPHIPSIMQTCEKVCAAQRPFQLAIAGTGIFPNLKKPRVLWAGITEDKNMLINLQQQLEDSLCATGFAKEKRSFSPHLTVGRIRSSKRTSQLIKIFMAERIKTIPFTVNSVSLFKSVLTPQGPKYFVLGTFPFKN